ncbi:hypothetical protein BKA61DRAFT_426871, partial [Leptodontidium sp. MPI-SDFR-AT-0119]
EALRSFERDETTRVILVSIASGGTGQWNPMAEEQALCRVHRMGQERKVTTIR